jgi:hypothetical protein
MIFLFYRSLGLADVNYWCGSHSEVSNIEGI